MQLVNIQTIDPTIAIELRYASTRNVTERALYPANMPALVRPSVAQRLVAAQSYLRGYGFGLKIWDAYRPKLAHEQLWQLSRNTSYVANPKDKIGSLHTRGVAVDATLVDLEGRAVAMPTDFDDFTPAAILYYRGPDPVIRANLHRLQTAMARVGFYGLRTEWWHFIAADWAQYRVIAEIKLSSQPPPGAGTRLR